jgi:hypothetical protein
MVWGQIKRTRVDLKLLTFHNLLSGVTCQCYYLRVADAAVSCEEDERIIPRVSRRTQSHSLALASLPKRRAAFCC